jgi:penicillin-binding protein 1A
MSKQKLLIQILLLILILGIIPLAFSAALPVINRLLGAPDLKLLENYQPIGSIEIYDYRDDFVGVLQGKEDRQVVKLSQISDYMKQAVLAAEDNNFYRHNGFSFEGFFRALITNIKAGKIVQGGSTLTQQMVKNLFIKEDDRYKRTFTRKIVELLIAFEVESKYDKDKIFEIYLNQVYFGKLAYGIERAAQRYFSKSASRLDLRESAFLAGLLTAPSYLSDHLEDALKRQNYVLRKMKENGYIDQTQYEEAIKNELKLSESTGNFSIFPYYFSLVDQELNKRFSREELKFTGIKVYTSLDPVAQRLAKRYLELGVSSAAEGINQAALVSIDVESAQVRALVGGTGDFWKYQYNRATNPHTLGSAFKPFVYLTAFMKGLVDTETIIEDSPLKILDPSAEEGFWTPQNFDEEFHGPISVRAALTFSRNIPAVKVAMQTGIEDIIKTAKAAGFKSKMEPLLSLALGAQAFTPLEVANAYSTLARGGVRIDPIIIRKITDAKGRVLEENNPIPIQSLPERDVSKLVDILQGVVSYGTGSFANIPGRYIAGKTGTADGSRDIWFTGFSPDTVSTVWCGNERNKEVKSRYATGGSTPAWIWREYMTKFYEERPKPIRNFPFSINYIERSIDPITGLLATEYTPNPIKKHFIPGTEPTRYAPVPDGEDIRKRKSTEKSTLSGFFQEASDDDKKLKKAKKLEKEINEDQEIQIIDTEQIRARPKPIRIESNSR